MTTRRWRRQMAEEAFGQDEGLAAAGPGREADRDRARVDRSRLFRSVGPLGVHGGARFQTFCRSSATDRTWATRQTVL